MTTNYKVENDVIYRKTRQEIRAAGYYSLQSGPYGEEDRDEYVAEAMPVHDAYITCHMCVCI